MGFYCLGQCSSRPFRLLLAISQTRVEAGAIACRAAAGEERRAETENVPLPHRASRSGGRPITCCRHCAAISVTDWPDDHLL